MVTVKRALLSCYDKTGLGELAQGLATLGIELVATGGTASTLQRQGLRVKTVEAFAGISAQLDGRVKTLHPALHAGILAKRDDPHHLSAVRPESLIDLVVVNLYPFEETARKPSVALAEAVEQIDIGGVALLRAAAKNFQSVAVISHPTQYPQPSPMTQPTAPRARTVRRWQERATMNAVGIPKRAGTAWSRSRRSNSTSWQA